MEDKSVVPNSVSSFSFFKNFFEKLFPYDINTNLLNFKILIFIAQ